MLSSFVLMYLIVFSTVGTSEEQIVTEAQIQQSNSFSIVPSLNQLYGETTYRIKALSEIPSEPGELSEIRSELVFPLTTTLVGVTLNWDSGTKVWGIKTGFAVNSNEPTDPMIDRDWMGGSLVGYSESEAKMDMILAHFDARYRILHKSHTFLWLMVRLEYQKISQNISGYKGWQDFDMDGNQVPISGTGPVVDYEITYLTPQLGLGARFLLGDSTPLNVNVAAGVLFSSDTDNHLLRGRISEGEATGVSLNTNMDLRLFSFKSKESLFFFDLMGWLRYCFATGNQTQTWYSDEGNTPEGTVVTGIAYETESLQFGFGLQIGLEF